MSTLISWLSRDGHVNKKLKLWTFCQKIANLKWDRLFSTLDTKLMKPIIHHPNYRSLAKSIYNGGELCYFLENGLSEFRRSVPLGGQALEDPKSDDSIQLSFVVDIALTPKFERLFGEGV
jgi:hypothetical protein